MLSVFKTRLQAIRKNATTDMGATFETDLGRHVYLGVAPGLGQDDERFAIAILPGEVNPRWQVAGKVAQSGFPVAVYALASVEIDEPWEALEDGLADIKRAVELQDRTLGGLLEFPLERVSERTVPREPGDLTTGIEVTYLARVREGWGNP